MPGKRNGYEGISGWPHAWHPQLQLSGVRLRHRETTRPWLCCILASRADRKLHGDKLEQNPTGSEDEAARNIGFSLREALKADCAWICRNADAVAVLPGWEISRGANAEVALAKALGLTIIILGKEFVK